MFRKDSEILTYQAEESTNEVRGSCVAGGEDNIIGSGADQ